MTRRSVAVFFMIPAILFFAHFGVRAAFDRTRPDIAAWVSFDDGLWSFEKTFEYGPVGPFEVGQSREDARRQLENVNLFENDRSQIGSETGDWRIALPAQGGGYGIYTVQFDGNHIASIKTYYAVLAGL